jgi:hypothetical protein
MNKKYAIFRHRKHKQPIVIVRLNGGLGNQMFQYVAGKYVAKKGGSIIKVDLTHLKNINAKKFAFRKYALDIFEVPILFATYKEILKFTIPRFKPRYLYFGLKHLYKDRVIEQKDIRYSNILDKVSSDCYLVGSFQSEKFFRPIAHEVKEDFQIKKEILNQYSQIISEVSSVESVAVHIRRGDYVNNPKTREVHGSMPISYYIEAAKLIGTRVRNPHFYIFSDEPEWLSNNLDLKADFSTIPSRLDDHPNRDFVLMMHCKHHIITNSSYSWWAAWLGENFDKIVIAPKKWFAVSACDSSDIVPESWIRL